MARPSVNLFLFVCLALPASFAAQGTPEIGAVETAGSMAKLPASGNFVRIDPRPKTANSIYRKHTMEDCGSSSIQLTGRDFAPPESRPAAYESPLVAPEIFHKAEALGLVRVIVELRLSPHKEDSESSRENAIGVSQKALLDELAQVELRVIRSYSSIPALVLAASVDALKIIAVSRHVMRVTEDGLSIPLKPLEAAE